MSEPVHEANAFECVAKAAEGDTTVLTVLPEPPLSNSGDYSYMLGGRPFSDLKFAEAINEAVSKKRAVLLRSADAKISLPVGPNSSIDELAHAWTQMVNAGKKVNYYDR